MIVCTGDCIGVLLHTGLDMKILFWYVLWPYSASASVYNRVCKSHYVTPWFHEIDTLSAIQMNGDLSLTYQWVAILEYLFLCKILIRNDKYLVLQDKNVKKSIE